MLNPTDFAAALNQAASTLPAALEANHVELMWRHFLAVLETNAQFNLTRITDPVAAAVKLYADSLAPLAWLERRRINVKSCLDVGTGAGIPAIPVAILRPSWRVTAIDSTAKKLRFVERCAADLELKNLLALHARAEEWRPGKRFDLVLFKAVGALDRCVRLAAGLTQRHGHVFVFKGPNVTHEEIDAAAALARPTGLQLWDVFEYTLPCGSETLHYNLMVFHHASP